MPKPCQPKQCQRLISTVAVQPARNRHAADPVLPDILVRFEPGRKKPSRSPVLSRATARLFLFDGIELRSRTESLAGNHPLQVLCGGLQSRPSAEQVPQSKSGFGIKRNVQLLVADALPCADQNVLKSFFLNSASSGIADLGNQLALSSFTQKYFPTFGSAGIESIGVVHSLPCRQVSNGNRFGRFVPQISSGVKTHESFRPANFCSDMHCCCCVHQFRNCFP